MSETETETQEPLQYVDLDQLQSIFDRLERMDVELDADPLVYGPKRLNEKISITRKYLSETERIFIDLTNKLRLLTSLHRSESNKFDLLIKNALANDPDVRMNRAQGDRIATATMKNRALQVEVNRMADAILQFETTLKTVKSKRADLKDLQSRLRDQIKLCQEEIGLGGEWGSRTPRGNLPKPNREGGAGLVDRALSGAGDEDDILGVVEGWPGPAVANATSEEAEDFDEDEPWNIEEAEEESEDEGEDEGEETADEASSEPSEDVMARLFGEDDEPEPETEEEAEPEPEPEPESPVYPDPEPEPEGADVLEFPAEGEIASDDDPTQITTTNADEAEAFLDADVPEGGDAEGEETEEELDIDSLLAKF